MVSGEGRNMAINMNGRDATGLALSLGNSRAQFQYCLEVNAVDAHQQLTFNIIKNLRRKLKIWSYIGCNMRLRSWTKNGQQMHVTVYFKTGQKLFPVFWFPLHVQWHIYVTSEDRVPVGTV